MSMRSYPVFDTGLVITDEMLPYMIRAAIVKFNDIALTERDAAIMKMSVQDFAEAVKEKSLTETFFDDYFLHMFVENDPETPDLQFIDEFEGHAFTNFEIENHFSIDEDKLYDEYYSESGVDHIMYMALKKGPMLFRQQYTSPEEAIEEVKDNLKDYLKFIPDNFDYRPLICDIVGTTFG